MTTMVKSTPQWQPLTMLPVFSEMIDGMLESSQMYLKTMKEVEQNPYIMDDETLARTLKLYTEQLEDHGLFEQQFIHWKKEPLTKEQVAEIERLEKQATALKTSNEKILVITKSIEHSTINKIMDMDDAELGLDILTGKIKPPV